MIQYKENPPRLTKDKEFVDEMTNLLTEAICEREKLLETIIMTEYLNPTTDTRNVMEEAYSLLEETDINLGQLAEAFKIKIIY
jgi:hypothetical protein